MCVKKIIAVNGSPRKKGSTAELLENALRGAKDAGAETELVNLYSLNFKGCISCGQAASFVRIQHTTI